MLIHVDCVPEATHHTKSLFFFRLRAASTVKFFHSKKKKSYFLVLFKEIVTLIENWQHFLLQVLSITKNFFFSIVQRSFSVSFVFALFSFLPPFFVRGKKRKVVSLQRYRLNRVAKEGGRCGISDCHPTSPLRFFFATFFFFLSHLMKEEIETNHFEHTFAVLGDGTALQSHASPKKQVEVCCAFHQQPPSPRGCTGC